MRALPTAMLLAPSGPSACAVPLVPQSIAAATTNSGARGSAGAAGTPQNLPTAGNGFARRGFRL